MNHEDLRVILTVIDTFPATLLYVLKLINNSSSYKSIRIRQFDHMCAFRNPDETLDRGFSTILCLELDKMSNPIDGEFILI